MDTSNQQLSLSSMKYWDFSRLDPHTLQAHMQSSIPGYAEGHNIVRLLSHYFIKDYSRIYDIGCGPGKLTEMLAKEHLDKTGLDIVGIDPYVRHYHSFFKEIEDNSFHSLSFSDERCTEYVLKECDFVVLYYTLQFLGYEEKSETLNKIFTSLRRGGAVLLFDKVIDDDPLLHDLQTGAYDRFKVGQGIPPEDIINKRLSLMGCMKPLKKSSLLDAITNCNHKVASTVIFKYLSFEGYLVIKE